MDLLSLGAQDGYQDALSAPGKVPILLPLRACQERGEWLEYRSPRDWKAVLANNTIVKTY